MVKTTIIIFFIWRLIGFLTIFLAEKFIPYLGFFPYKEELLTYHLPKFIYSLANFDGLHYLHIAQNGYSQYEQAFFPFYPLLIKLINPIFNNYLITGLFIANFSFLLGLIFFINYLNHTIKNFTHEKQLFFILFLTSFPTSFFFGNLYTEGLFFLLFSLTLFFLKKEKYFLASIFGFFTAITRLIGLFLFIPIIFYWLEKINKKNQLTLTKIFFIITTVFSPILGLLSYCFYLWKTTGDPLMFFHAQPAFGANRSTHLIILPQVIWRYLKIFFTAKINFQYFISFFELTTFLLILTILIIDFSKNFFKKNLSLIGLNLFSLVNLLLPSLTGTFSSIPRYSLFSLSFFLYLTTIKNLFLKTIILFLFLIIQIIIFSFFIQGYFVS